MPRQKQAIASVAAKAEKAEKRGRKLENRLFRNDAEAKIGKFGRGKNREAEEENEEHFYSSSEKVNNFGDIFSLFSLTNPAEFERKTFFPNNNNKRL